MVGGLVFLAPPVGGYLAPNLAWSLLTGARGRATVADRLAEHGEVARARLRPHFERAGVAYPPRAVALVGLKQERRLEVYGAASRDEGAGGAMRWIASYPVLAASGELGPKLRQGDQQVPEGLYRIESLNPNSRFHLSLRVDYPNAFDRARGAEDGRSNLGGDIMIHGSRYSIGCLAMGDPAIEELFVLVAETGREHVEVILAPLDFRRPHDPTLLPGNPPWSRELYRQVAARLERLPQLVTPPLGPR